MADVPRRVWEDAINDLREKAKKAYEDGDTDLQRELGSLIDLIIRGYKDRFGDPYPDQS